MEYIEKHSEAKECFLCAAASGRGELVVARESQYLVVMNKFPYNSGHILVAPMRHVSRLEDLSVDERLPSWRASPSFRRWCKRR